MIQESQTNKIDQQNSMEISQSLGKSKVKQDDTLSLQSDRSRGFINQKIQDWPSWTIDENQKKQMINEQINKPVQIEEAINQKKFIANVNQHQINQVQKIQANVTKKKRYGGRGAIRFLRLQKQKQQRLQQRIRQSLKVPIQEGTLNQGKINNK